MKPKLLLIGGWNWSATSPLIYTLQRNARYAHFGFTKTFKYLHPKGLQNKLTDQPEKKISFIYEKVCDGTWENYKSQEPFSHRMNLSVDLEPLKDFPRKHFADLIAGSPTITKYLTYYHSLYDHVVSKGYKSVADGYIGQKYNNKIFYEYYQIIKSEFDVKLLLIARDPVRRAFSEYLANLQKVFDKRRRKSLPISLDVINYMRDIKNIYSIFGKENVHIIVMEEMWGDDGSAKKLLSEFLDHPVTDLWKNLYVPDIGHLVEYDKDVPCQAYGQDILQLTPETYYYYKNKYQSIYNSWIKYFGKLPMNWG